MRHSSLRGLAVPRSEAMIFPLAFSMIMIITEAIIMKIPTASEDVNGSPRNSIPQTTALNGSNAPSTEVIVEPMLLTAEARVRHEKTVDSTAKSIVFAKAPHDPISCMPPYAEASITAPARAVTRQA